MTSYLLKDSKVNETGSSQQTKLETLHGRQEQVECERRTERTKQLKRREGGRERERKLVNTNTAKTPAHKASPTPGNLVTSTKVAATSTKVLVWWCQATSCQKAIYIWLALSYQYFGSCTRLHTSWSARNKKLLYESLLALLASKQAHLHVVL